VGGVRAWPVVCLGRRWGPGEVVVAEEKLSGSPMLHLENEGTGPPIGPRVQVRVAPAWPLSSAGITIGVWTLIGLIYLVYLHRAHPERLRDTKKVFVSEEVPEAVEM
jgi:hypothetical protein